MNQDKDNESVYVWAVIATIAAIFFAIAWYGASRGSSSSSENKDTPTTVSATEYENAIDEYKEALYKANETIEESNECVDDSFRLLDSDYMEDGLSSLDQCRFDTISDPEPLY